MDDAAKIGLATGALGAGLVYKKNKDKVKNKYGLKKNSNNPINKKSEYMRDLIANSPEIAYGLKKK